MSNQVGSRRSEKQHLLSTVSFRALAITGVAIAGLTVVGACSNVGPYQATRAQISAPANPCNPTASANSYSPTATANPCSTVKPSNPCAGKVANASAGNPCAAKKVCNPCAAKNPCNPCAAKNPCNPSAAKNPCNPCAAKATAAVNPCSARTPLARGVFYDGPHGHNASSNAQISRSADGTYWLTFSQFASDRGPDINIVLSPAIAPRTDAAVKQAGYITIAARKALTGDQSYRLPPDFDPRLYQSVVIWCEAFGVLFGAAQLQGA